MFGLCFRVLVYFWVLFGAVLGASKVGFVDDYIYGGPQRERGCERHGCLDV